MRCTGCSQDLHDGVVVCPHCGAYVAGDGAGASRWLLVVSALGLFLSGAAFSVLAHAARKGPVCDGGKIASVDWKVEESTAPRDADAGRWSCLELRSPAGLSYVHLADVRHQGNATYAWKEQNEFPHVHDSVCTAVRSTGANAFYSDPPRDLGDGQFEIVSHAILVYEGAAPSAPGVPVTLMPGQRECVVVGLEAGSSAARGGLRVGDTIGEVNHAAVTGGDPCSSVLQRLGAVPRGAPVTVAVANEGVARTLTLTRPNAGLYGYSSMGAPRAR